MNDPHAAIRDCRFAAIDFESAGSAPGRGDSPVQIGLAAWSPADGHGAGFVSYLRPDHPVRWSARRVHGIGPRELEDAPPLVSLWPEVKARLAGRAIVAHGRGTERRFLRAFPGHGFGPWVDTLPLARALWPGLDDHSLGSICEALELTPRIRQLVPGRSWHDAWFDAAASAVLLEHVVRDQDLGSRPLALLLPRGG